MTKRSFIDSIEVKNPCSEDWDKMSGSDRVRFCSHCDLSVNNISLLTRKQAMRLVRESKGGICVHYVVNPVDNKPVFAEKLYQITRRASIAAGVLGAALSLSTIAYAQGKPVLRKRASETETSQKYESEKDKIETAGITGFVTDPNGAIVPNAWVNVMNEETKEAFAMATDEKGAYKFENLAAGNYKMTVNAGAAFAEIQISGVTASENSETRQDVSLSFAEIAVVNVTAESEIYNVVNGGAIFVQYRTGLHLAVSDDDAEEVKNLIARGNNVNEKDENYSHITPLFIAVENGNAAIAETLLSFGAKVNVKDDNQQTPLMRLDEDASAELANLLIKYGAKVNLTDKEGNNALILAARSVNPEVLQILINHTANINAQNREGRSALMEAADADNLENVRALLEAGANVNFRDNDGESAYDLTTDEEIEKLLVEYGAVTEEISQ